jgi:CubicO group peptidase (beta-lactamase class C family)
MGNFINKSQKFFFLAVILLSSFNGLCENLDEVHNGKVLNQEILDNMVKKIQDEKLEINSVIIVKNNQLVFEKYFNEKQGENPQLTYHIINSVISTLIGICIDEGLIRNVDQKVISLFPEYEKTITDSLQQEITIEHLLTMTGGYKWNSEHHNNEIQEFVENPNLLEYMFKCPIENKPGIAFFQNSGGIFLLTKIIEKVSSTRIDEFADEKLFKPLKIQNYRWERDLTGKTKGPYALYMSPSDLAKLGFLYLNKGKYKGKEIVSKEWIEEATRLHFELTPMVPISKGIGQNGMGYLWWNFRGMFAAQGHCGQKLFVIPSKKAAIVITANTNFYLPTRLYLDFIKEAIY